MERAMGFEPTTLCLGSKYSTTELHPPAAGQSHCNTSQAVCHQGTAAIFKFVFSGLYATIKPIRPRLKGHRLGPAARTRRRRNLKTALPFHKKILYYGLMLFLTLLALEGMAHLAYYAAYNQWYGDGPSELPADYITPTPHQNPTDRRANPWFIRHPLYGYTRNLPYHDLNAMPLRQRRADTAVIGLLGGSVARDVQPYLRAPCNAGLLPTICRGSQ